MPFLLNLIKNPKVLMYGAIGILVAGLFIWGKMTASKLEASQANLAVAEQNITVLESSIEAERKKAQLRQQDAADKQLKITQLREEKEALNQDFADTKTELNHILTTVLPGIKTEEDLIKAKETIEEAVTTSYGCIEAATGSKPCAQ